MHGHMNVKLGGKIATLYTVFYNLTYRRCDTDAIDVSGESNKAIGSNLAWKVQKEEATAIGSVTSRLNSRMVKTNDIKFIGKRYFNLNCSTALIALITPYRPS